LQKINSIKVSVIPRSGAGLKNRMFSPETESQLNWVGNSHWKERNVVWYKESLKEGVELCTYDLLAPESADIVLFIDLPKKHSELEMWNRKLTGVIKILLLKESPLWPFWFRKENHEIFDAVLTYNTELVDNKKYFHVPLPKSSPPSKLSSLDFQNRKKCVLLNTNYYTGFKSARTPYHYFQKLVKFKSEGWVFSYRDAYQLDNQYLYEERRKIVKLTNEIYPGLIDVYGKGWEGKSGGWYYTFIPDRNLCENPAPFEGEKLELFQHYRFVIAYENFRNDIGYFSEKMFDAFYGGAVPIYLGEENIKDYIDKKCFIDSRDFKSRRELLKFIDTCDEGTWLEFRHNIDQFLNSESIESFLPKRYASRINTVISKISKSKKQH